MSPHDIGLVAIIVLVSVMIGAALTLAAQDPSTYPLGPILTGLGAIMVGLLGLNILRRRDR